MRISDPIVVTGTTAFPSMGALLGTHVNPEVFESINRHGHQNFFGEEFDKMRENFFKTHVEPSQKLALELSKTVNAILNPDRMRILNSIEDFRSIPLSMEMPILLYEPVRKAFEEGRIYGFGYDPSTLPQEDVYGRLIDNFSCDDVEKAMDEEGYYPITGTMYTDDPDLSDDELWSIARTRDFIRNKILRDTKRDPTDIDSIIG